MPQVVELVDDKFYTSMDVPMLGNKLAESNAAVTKENSGKVGEKR